jgi:hypothetical protein
MSPLAFWTGPGKRLQALKVFRDAMRNLMVSEAAVERSFHTEALVWSALRNRMKERSVDDVTFVKMNFPRVRLTKSPAKQRRFEDVKREEWQRLLESMKDSAPRTPRPQRRTVLDVRALRVGSNVEVLWKVKTGRVQENQWFSGTIVEVVTPNAEFVVYWTQSKKTTPFRPLTTDTEWRFTAPPGI